MRSSLQRLCHTWCSPLVVTSRLESTASYSGARSCVSYNDFNSAQCSFNVRGLSSTPAASTAEGSMRRDTEVVTRTRRKDYTKPRPLFAACVLERLPVVLPKPEDWEVEFEVWLTHQKLKQGSLKEYPKLVKPGATDSRQREQEQHAQKHFTPVPRVTKADMSGDVRSMKRRLDQRLYLLVRQQLDNGQEGWRFPQAQHQAGETLSETSERAIFNTVGRKYPIFFIGNAPAGWLPYWPTGARMFYQMAQVVDDPWLLNELPASSSATDYAWLTKAEAQQRVEARLSELLERML